MKFAAGDKNRGGVALAAVRVPIGRGKVAGRGVRCRGVDGRRRDGVAAVRRCAGAGRRDSRREAVEGTVRWRGSRGGAIPSGASCCGRQCTGGVGADGWAVVVGQEVGKLVDTRGGEGEVTGGDQRLAAPSCPLTWPCRHRHHDHSLTLGLKWQNQPCHLVPNSKYYHFVEVRIGWFATFVKQEFQQTLLARKENGFWAIKMNDNWPEKFV